MVQPFSEETQELLERAQQAIDHSARLHAHTKQCLAAAERRTFQLELAIREMQAELYGRGK